MTDLEVSIYTRPPICMTMIQVFSEGMKILYRIRRPHKVRWNHGLAKTKQSLNAAKCEYMFCGNDKQFSTNSKACSIEIDKNEIKRVVRTKYLGLTINDSLS